MRPSIGQGLLANNLFYGDMIWLIHAEHSAQLFFQNQHSFGDEKALQISKNLKAIGKPPISKSFIPEMIKGKQMKRKNPKSLGFWET